MLVILAVWASSIPGGGQGGTVWALAAIAILVTIASFAGHTVVSAVEQTSIGSDSPLSRTK